MTINVSVRVANGIVMASDSLASTMLDASVNVNVPSIPCQKCGEDTGGGVAQVPISGIPGNSTPLANKLFYIGNFGAAFFGSAFVNSRSLWNHVMVFVTTQYKSGQSLSQVADALAAMLEAAVKADPSCSKHPPGTVIVGFQLSGYDETDIDCGRTVMVEIPVGAGINKRVDYNHDITVTGQLEVVNRLFAPIQNGANLKPSFPRMEMLDAVDYARFLVQTSIDYQRFADRAPTVGGPIEIAFITKWAGFRWVERKKILDDDDVRRFNVGKMSHELSQLRRDLPDIIRDSRTKVPADI